MHSTWRRTAALATLAGFTATTRTNGEAVPGPTQADFWLARRDAARREIWPQLRGALPREDTPRQVLPTNVSGMTSVVWVLSGLPAGLPMTSTVFHKLRSAQARRERAFILHHGHDGARFLPYPPSAEVCGGTPPDICWWDHYNASAFLADLADADVFLVSMPLEGVNIQPPYPTNDHRWFQQWEEPGASPLVNSSTTLRYFLEPVVLTLNYAEKLGYREFHMLGLSGGGWTTTVVAALDPRIRRSFPDAGSTPLSFKHTSWDYEQLPQRSLYGQCNYLCMYVLAALEPGRVSVQVLHEDDPCCFAGRGVHDEILAYNGQVQAELQLRGAGRHGWFTTAVADWPRHEVAARDKSVVAAAWGVAASGSVSPADYARLPCDILRASAVPCHENAPPAQLRDLHV